jgi:hypothetical protein
VGSWAPLLLPLLAVGSLIHPYATAQFAAFLKSQPAIHSHPHRKARLCTATLSVKCLLPELRALPSDIVSQGRSLSNTTLPATCNDATRQEAVSSRRGVASWAEDVRSEVVLRLSGRAD